jgi:solute carrier family 35
MTKLNPQKVPSKMVSLAVGIMTAGAVLAAANDLNVTLVGVLFVFLNNVCSAAQGVYVKRCLPHLGQFGVLFYNALLALAPTLLLTLARGGLEQMVEFALWRDWQFVVVFVVSCVMGAVLQYSVVLCVHHNSALTASIMGSVKNVSVTYVGMFVGGDYVFTVLNFVGINVSVFGTLVYMWLTFGSKKK